MLLKLTKACVTNLCYEYNNDARRLEMAPSGVYLAFEQGE